MATDPVKVHLLPVRITHWVNAMWILVLNGMIYLACGIAAIFVTNENPGGYWEDKGYNWYSGS